MKLKLKIQLKIQLFIISSSIIIYITAVGYISFNARKKAYDDAIIKTQSIAKEAAKDMKALLDVNMGAVKSLTDAFRIYKDYPIDQWHEQLHKMYLNVYDNNPSIYGLWDSWELSMIDSTWEKSYGRISHSYWRLNGVIKDIQEYRSMNGDSELYLETKSTLIPSINEPYFDVVTGDKTESLLMTSLNSPLVEDGKFVAVVSFDITLGQLQEIVEKIKPFKGSYAFLLSNNGVVSGHPNKEFLNIPVDEIFPDDNKEFKIKTRVKKGDEFSYISKDINGVKTYYSYAPVSVAFTETPWSIAISVPIDVVMEDANRNFRISLLVGVIGILLLVLVIAIISKNITNPLNNITKLLMDLSKGRIDKSMKVQINSGDEIEQMANTLNESIDGLNKKVDFANNIKQGNLDYDFTLLSDQDILGSALIEMRNSLINARKEEEKRKVEDEKRRWANEGLATFADILRQNNDNLENLATEIIKNLINYLKANQGGLFILNDEDVENVHFSLLSAFAYDRRKYLQKHIQMGEGLVGICVIEKKTIFMTDIPQDYIEITSGLGGANPNSLLIVPLKIEENLFGVIEIASFNIFEKHEIEFVEKLAESIASTLQSVRVNIRTNELLERSQQQAEEMAAQEEEMRQNMEELQATQEESTRKNEEVEKLLEQSQKQAEEIESRIVEFEEREIVWQIKLDSANNKIKELEEKLKGKI